MVTSVLQNLQLGRSIAKEELMQASPFGRAPLMGAYFQSTSWLMMLRVNSWGRRSIHHAWFEDQKANPVSSINEKGDSFRLTMCSSQKGTFLFVCRAGLGLWGNPVPAASVMPIAASLHKVVCPCPVAKSRLNRFELQVRLQPPQSRSSPIPNLDGDWQVPQWRYRVRRFIYLITVELPSDSRLSFVQPQTITRWLITAPLVLHPE